MKYISTRGKASALSFDEVLLSGLASDGGLYVPAVWPWFSEKDIKAMSEKSYEEIAFNVLQPFVSGSITEGKLKGIKLNSLWLRERLSGEKYVDPNNLQRLYEPSLLDESLGITKHSIDNNILKVEFTDGASGSFSIDDL